MGRLLFLIATITHPLRNEVESKHGIYALLCFSCRASFLPILNAVFTAIKHNTVISSMRDRAIKKQTFTIYTNKNDTNNKHDYRIHCNICNYGNMGHI